jgi:hypothetical protein
MRVTIIPSDGTVYVDHVAYGDIDMTWVPDIDEKKIHAVQWLDSEGEIEFVGPHQNIKIKTLGVFQKGVDLWKIKKQEHEWLIKKQLEEEEKRKKEEEERLQAQFLETHIPASEDEDEDEDLFYDIEELLKEI